MPKITSITPQRREGRYSVFIDGKFYVGLGELELQTSGLRIGQELDADEIEKLKQQSQLGKAVDAAYRLLSYRQRSRMEIEQTLLRKGYDDETVAAVLVRLQDQGYIDDWKFARDWAEDQRQLKNSSQIKIRTDLRAKGIDPSIIESVLGELGNDEDSILKLIESRSLLSKYPEREKLIQFLAGRGFRYDNVKAALQRLEED
jgi:regulatory protein